MNGAEPGPAQRGRRWAALASFVAVMLAVLMAATGASGLLESPQTTPPLAVSLAQAVPPLALARGLPPGADVGIGTSRGVTHSLFLPLAAQAYGPAADSPFGVQIHGFPGATVDRLVASGTSWIRIPLHWDQIEPLNTTPDSYQWPASLDAGLARLSAHNIRIVLTLMGNPEWAATYPAGPIDRADIGELVEFIEASAARYRAPPYHVTHWEMYNEPDNGSELLAQTGGWGYFGTQPGAYVAILSAVYAPLKAVVPDAQILIGGVAYDNWTSTGGPFVQNFLDQVLQQGGGAYFDLMNFHYYPAFRHNWDPYGLGITGKASFLRGLLANYGLDKPFVCTEASMWSDAAHGGSDELQSRYVPQLYARSLVASLEITIWYPLVDADELGAWKSGLVNPDYTPKPAFSAFQTAVHNLAPASYVRTLGPGETGSPQIEAHEFLGSGGTPRVLVAWTNDEATHPLSLETDKVMIMDKVGESILRHDADDGVLDGFVQVQLGPSPVYLHFQPGA
jgi:hypothetical protein